MNDLATPRSMPRTAGLVLTAFVAVGVVTFAVGLAQDADRTYRVFLYNWLLWAALAQGALCLACAMRLTNATWQGPIQRIAESIGAFFPLSFLLYFVIWIGRHHLFEWSHGPIAGKEWWYEEGLLFWRDVIALGWMSLVSGLYLYISVRPTLAQARERATGWRRGLYARWTAGWRGDEAERDLATRRGRKISAVLVLSYALCYSILAIDLIMSLVPDWVSTMFPGYFAWGGFLSAVALVTLVSLAMRHGPDLEGEITESRRHDLGKMVFAFSIFWMYLFWSQYLVIWYGNIPEETGFVSARLGSQFLQGTWYMEGFWTRVNEPYALMTLFTWVLLWVLPFWVLLGARPKKSPAVLGSICAGSMFGFWLERYILVTPSLIKPEEVLAGAQVSPFGLIELGIALGFIGLFFLSFLAFSRVFPGAIPVKST